MLSVPTKVTGSGSFAVVFSNFPPPEMVADKELAIFKEPRISLPLESTVRDPPVIESEVAENEALLTVTVEEVERAFGKLTEQLL